MPILESLIALVSPLDCLACGTEGELVCYECWNGLPAAPVEPPVIDGIGSLSARTSYSGLAKKVIKAIKFDRAQSGIGLMAKGILEYYFIPKGALLVPVTTAPIRYRQRGYDQAVLLAKKLSKMSGRNMVNVLARQAKVRQLGATRTKRMHQLDHAYRVSDPDKVIGRRIVLVDDVVTTGATLQAAAAALLAAGAQSVDAVVFAQA